ncbi:tetratricopeptide repeat protein [Terriglobus tenax]|uniref:tetratricopeptide repeat protein n=1 Tax=Terriglobus tenax TaxID=1111115 RepID=UPI0021DF6C17|nr:hypothetical protein [Terriglobus tenax]
MKRFVVAVLVCASVVGMAQKKKKPKLPPQYQNAASATVLHPANVYVASDEGSQRLSLVTPGHEVTIMDRSPGWVRVFANTDEPEENDSDAPEIQDDQQSTPVSGWIKDKGVIGPSTPNGDKLLFGAAVIAESQAAEPHAPKDAGASAHFLYKRLFEYYPKSPLAPEAAWRSADIRWQLQKADYASLPSAREMDPNLRPRMYEDELKKVIKYFPDTKYAALAAYELIDAKLCGDWQGLPKCPEKETEYFEKYSREYPDGPKTAEALWQAVYRQGVASSMYRAEDDKKKSDNAAVHANALNDQLQARFGQTDWAARGAALVYRLQQGIPVYGNDRD